MFIPTFSRTKQKCSSILSLQPMLMKISWRHSSRKGSGFYFLRQKFLKESFEELMKEYIIIYLFRSLRFLGKFYWTISCAILLLKYVISQFQKPKKTLTTKKLWSNCQKSTVSKELDSQIKMYCLLSHLCFFPDNSCNFSEEQGNVLYRHTGNKRAQIWTLRIELSLWSILRLVKRLGYHLFSMENFIK